VNFEEYQVAKMALNSTRLFGLLSSRGVAQLSQRTIVSKALREKKEKPAPYPYLKKRFMYFDQILDRTLPRFDENSKLIVVEGAPGVGKTELAKELADQFEMMYIPPVTHDTIYTGPYNVDYRKWNDMYPDWFKCFGEKDFIKNPLGHTEGTCDRYHHRVLKLKWINQLRAQRHIMNTGQGVVMEGCAHSDYCHFNAANNAGWILDETPHMYQVTLENVLFHVPRPNLIVYLDAPADVSQKNIKAMGNEWDKDSPVWNNTQYLTDIADEYKNNWLRDMQQFSRVLVYDWSEGGDTEVVIEDIEAAELDMIELYSDQQKDWRFHNETTAAQQRFQCTNPNWIKAKLKCFTIDELWYNEIWLPSAEDTKTMYNLMRHVSQERFAPGANKHLGDNTFLMDLFGLHTRHTADAPFFNYNMFFQRSPDWHHEAYASEYEFKHTKLE